MTTIDAIAQFLDEFAPPRLAEEWDNVGLLVGDRQAEVARVMTCLTVTPASAAEAIEAGVQLIVAHHPMPFRPVRRLTTATTVGRILWDLAAAKVAVFSPHTAFDSAVDGINQRLASGLELRGISALIPHEKGGGTGRYGWLEEPIALEVLAERVKQFLGISGLHLVGNPQQSVRLVAVACGAADDLLPAAARLDCDAMLLGETRFHTCLEAEAGGIGLILPGHFASERFAVEGLADALAGQFPELDVWPSRRERDPLRWIG